MDEFMKVWRVAERIDGWFAGKEAEAIYNLAKASKDAVVEVGSYVGRSSYVLAAAGPVTCIDPFDGVLPLSPHIKPKDTWIGFKKNVLDGPWGKNVTVIKGRDEDVFPTWTKPVGFLFLDHDHRDGPVRRSLLGWKPHMVSGARVVLHDYGHERYPDVKSVCESVGLHIERVVLTLGIGYWP